MFRIRDIMIRIRIHGSLSHTYRSGFRSGSGSRDGNLSSTMEDRNHVDIRLSYRPASLCSLLHNSRLGSWNRFFALLRDLSSVSAPNPLFVRDLQDFKYNKLFSLLLFEGTFTIILHRFSDYIYLMIEGPGSETGSVPLPNRSGRPKNLRILRILIRNTA